MKEKKKVLKINFFNRKRTAGISAGLVLIFVSCSNQLSDIMLRSTSDPFCDVCSIDFMSESGVIYLDWKSDECADEYILMRAEDSNVPSFEKIYSGKNCRYKDSPGSEWTRYLYRLDKKRGKVTFKGNKVAYGFCSAVEKDQYEDNDSIEKAVELEDDRSGNIYYCSFYDDTKVYDQDWYYVTVPPHRTAEIILRDSELGSDSGLDTVFAWCTKSTNPEVLNQGGAITLTNTTEKTEKLYFEILPDKAKDGFGIGTESCVRSYELVLQHITKERT